MHRSVRASGKAIFHLSDNGSIVWDIKQLNMIIYFIASSEIAVYPK